MHETSCPAAVTQRMQLHPDSVLPLSTPVCPDGLPSEGANDGRQPNGADEFVTEAKSWRELMKGGQGGEAVDITCSCRGAKVCAAPARWRRSAILPR
jgi:hypothetical protein